jgi:NaMN:DMB phosphoribosyltransferase
MLRRLAQARRRNALNTPPQPSPAAAVGPVGAAVIAAVAALYLVFW